jgi:integrase
MKMFGITGKQREDSRMKTHAKKPVRKPDGFPKRLKEGNAEVTIYWQPNASRRRNPDTGEWEATGKVFDEFVLAYYQGTRQVADKKTGQLKTLPKFIRRKFGNLADAEREARFILTKLANAEGEVLKLTGLDRAAHVHAMQKLCEWRHDAELNSAVADYVAAVKRLPETVTLKECVNFYLSRHPIGLPRKTVREVVDEMLTVKTNAGISEPYAKELRLRLGQFADACAVPISTVSSKQIQDWRANRHVAGRTQNNYRRLISTLFRFAIRRGYLPKDHDELSGVEKIRDSGGEIEVFTPDELRKLFAACETPVRERGKWRTRQDMIPYLAIAAFCGLRAAEIQRLDWSEVHLTGAERFIEVKASKAKTASRRTVPISDNCVAWLAPYAKTSGSVAAFQRSDKQLFIYLAGKAGVPWKHNGLRHSFISYRLAIIKNVHQVSLEAGNSPNMVFAHYRQLVRESEAAEWFSIAPAAQSGAGEIIPMPAQSVAVTNGAQSVAPVAAAVM